MQNSWASRVVVLALLSVFSLSDVAFGRILWPERDGNPVLYPRRFGQQNPPVTNKIGQACPGQVCGVLSGLSITPLLAQQPECSQQDMADQIINASRQFDSATQANMIALAKEYRQAEKNTPPDFTTNPPTNRNSVFCQRAPANPELNGLVQAQDPANNASVFFDPALGKSVIKGTQANTEPFKGTASSTSKNDAANVPKKSSPPNTSKNDASSVPVCRAPASKTTSSGTPTPTPSPAPKSGSSLAGTGSGSGDSGAANFGSCTAPEIKFAVGLDGRRETAFAPVDPKSYNHGSADNIAVITQFMCDALTNTCKANQAAKTLCAQAQTAANAATPPQTGTQADVFNKVFGSNTNFAAVQPISNTGVPVSVPGAKNAPASTPAATGSGSSDSGAANFGSCTSPEIKFAVGLDGRKETAFVPVDQKSYNHGSAQNIPIITQFMCDALTNTCKANQAAKTLCAQAQTAANAATPPKTGTQADVFNKFFGFNTNFAAVQPISDTGVPISIPGANNAPASTPAATSSAPKPAKTGTPPPNTNGNLQTFTGNLGASPPPVTAAGNGQFQVQGNALFKNLQSALQRSCDVQHNQCANAANASGNQGDLTVANCGTQQDQCNAAVKA